MILNAKNILKTYGDKAILKDFNLSVKKGEFLGIVGPSGSGKSTLLSILATLDIADNGKLFFDNIDLTKLSKDEISTIRNEEFGFIFQHSNMLMHLNVKDNIALPFYYGKYANELEIEKRVNLLLSKVGLDGYANNEVKFLSGGEQQRAAIARALIKNPKIIFADEPTGNLDEKNSIKVLDMLKDLVNEDEKTIIIVTHDPLVIKYCTRVIELEKL
ncbi:MAG: ABC transporter ATP-binding protein [Campylobacterota bacterium]|nr:ABC transporter ATP-binding protein [Campylobacterota bacterium]